VLLTCDQLRQKDRKLHQVMIPILLIANNSEWDWMILNGIEWYWMIFDDIRWLWVTLNTWNDIKYHLIGLNDIGSIGMTWYGIKVIPSMYFNWYDINSANWTIHTKIVYYDSLIFNIAYRLTISLWRFVIL
jgi:hypothetical protein